MSNKTRETVRKRRTDIHGWTDEDNGFRLEPLREGEDGSVRVLKYGQGPDEITLLVRAGSPHELGSIEVVCW